jgi:transposase
VISRDRSSAYAQAATEGASQAEQVADRWHLLKNLREAVERVLERHSAVVDAALKTPETPADPACDAAVPESGAATSPVEMSPPRPPSEPLAGSPRIDAQPSKRQKRIDRFERVHELHRRGHSAARIARELSLSRRSVFRYLRRQTCPAWGLGGSRRSRLDGYREWIDARIAEGLTNAAELHRQLTERGFRGSYGSAYEFVTKRLGAAGKRRERINAAQPPVPARPSARQLSFEWARRAEKRKPAEAARLEAIRARSDELAAALDLADGLAELIRQRSRETLGEWLARAETASDPDLRRFAEGIRRDEAAVEAAVTQRWSNGPVEGHINRLKTIKRQMYGRAGFVSLRARVLNVV